MNSLLLRSAFRQRQALHISSKNVLGASMRGGGFHKPDPVPYAPYKNTRRHHLEDINTSWYSDIGPEFWIHLHSI